MSDLPAALEALVEAYADAGLPNAQGLLPPANDMELARACKRVGRRFPGELDALYRRHGGQESPADPAAAGVAGLFGRFRLHSPAELAADHEMFCETLLEDVAPQFPPEMGRFDPRLLPFASFDRWSLCIDADTGRVWEFSPNHGATGAHSLDSVAHALRVLADRLAAGKPLKLFAA